MVFTGHCLCGEVTYTIKADKPELVAYDHCDDCQRQTGSAYSLVFVCLKKDLTVHGPTKRWTGTAGSGNKVHRIFCSTCGSPIAHDPDGAPDTIAMKAGTLDDEYKKKLKPTDEIWTKGRLGFLPATRGHLTQHRGNFKPPGTAP